MPGILGAIVFIAIKFSGYILAGKVLKRLHPAIMDSVLKIALSRTIIGVILGPLLSLALVWLGGLVFGPDSNVSVVAFYPGLFVIRILVWALVIFYFVYGLGISKTQLWREALLGALWSCLLDVPGFFLAMIAPGRIGIC